MPVYVRQTIPALTPRTLTEFSDKSLIKSHEEDKIIEMHIFNHLVLGYIK